MFLRESTVLKKTTSFSMGYQPLNSENKTGVQKNFVFTVLIL